MSRSLCIFCGSSQRVDATYLDLAAHTGRLLAERGIRVVYGGASIGMMGVLADAALAHGGSVLGVIPAALEARELAHRGLTELRVVDTMHTRKKLMADESDGFVALPGGFGTLDELFEIVTWRQLGLHGKPVSLVNHCGFYDALVTWMRHAATHRFVPEAIATAVRVLDGVDDLAGWVEVIPERENDLR